MSRQSLHRALQCPRPGCDEWALIATEDEIRAGGVAIWSCAAGHRGPWISAA